MPTIAPPAVDEYADYYRTYIDRVPAGDFLTVFTAQAELLQTLLGDLPDGEDNKLHAPYTWTLKQLVGHMIDCERIFSTRMLRIGAGDETPIPAMDQDLYVANLDYESVSMQSLLDEFAALRKANVLLTQRFDSSALQRRGTASDAEVSARANLYILAGHVEYHVEIIRKRLNPV